MFNQVRKALSALYEAGKLQEINSHYKMSSSPVFYYYNLCSPCNLWPTWMVNLPRGRSGSPLGHLHLSTAGTKYSNPQSTLPPIIRHIFSSQSHSCLAPPLLIMAPDHLKIIFANIFEFVDTTIKI